MDAIGMLDISVNSEHCPSARLVLVALHGTVDAESDQWL